MNSTILIVEDHKDLSNYLREFLLDNEYIVLSASDGINALNIIKKTMPDLVLLDLGLPNMDGESVCREIKRNWPDLKIIILTAKNNTLDIVKGLNLGADDYITKPFQLEELLARIKARLRQNPKNSPVKIIGDLILNEDTHEVKRDGKSIELTATEFKLLDFLLSNPGKVLTRDMILSKIWLMSPDIESRSVDVYIGYLRRKIDSGFDQKLIHSIRGFGYILKN
jgi:two-component system response regulator MprA